MAINIRKQFAGVGLASGGGAFAPAPVPSGDLEITRALGGANLRRFDTLARAIDGETRALVAQGKAVAGLGESIQTGSHQPDRSPIWCNAAGATGSVMRRRRSGCSTCGVNSTSAWPPRTTRPFNIGAHSRNTLRGGLSPAT